MSEIEDANIIQDTPNTEAIKISPKFLLVHIVDPENPTDDIGMQFALNKEDKLVPEQALEFISAFSASKLPDGRTLIVTGHLKNGTTISKVYNAGSLEEYDEEVGLEFCKNEILRDVWKLLEQIYAIASYTPEKKAADDAKAEELKAKVEGK